MTCRTGFFILLATLLLVAGTELARVLLERRRARLAKLLADRHAEDARRRAPVFETVAEQQGHRLSRVLEALYLRAYGDGWSTALGGGRQLGFRQVERLRQEVIPRALVGFQDAAGHLAARAYAQGLQDFRAHLKGSQGRDGAERAYQATIEAKRVALAKGDRAPVVGVEEAVGPVEVERG